MSGRSVSYGFGTCKGCGRTSAARKDGKPWPHDTLSTRFGPLGRWACVGCDKPMDDIKPPVKSAGLCDCGRSTTASSDHPVTK